MERSLADAFAPARNTGIEAYDALGEDERATYAIGWFAAASDLNAFTRLKWEAIQANLDRAPVGDSQAYIAGLRFDMDF